MLSKRSFLSGVGASIALLGATRIASAAAENSSPLPYPTRPVRWIVPYAPGGATDVISRLVCQRLSQRLGRAFIVENKPGAGSNVGTEAVINSAADGYTLLLTSTANAINASFDKSLRFDFAQAIVPIAGIARIPLVMVINNELPVETIGEFIAYAKANPGKLSAASSGVGTSLHLSGELFKAMTGVDIVHVPYRGAYLPDLLGGQVQAAFSPISTSLDFIAQGKLRPLGVTSAERADVLRDVPALAEAVPGYSAYIWDALAAPRDTPAEIVETLNREINAVLADPTVRGRLIALGAEPMVMSVAQSAAFVADETAKWGKVIRSAGIKAE
jgi:tripartite-type tricarboxylate transporter receptor subunit TctC